MSGRIWPGALCVVRGARITAELNGRFVIAVRELRQDETYVNGYRLQRTMGGVTWVCRAAVDGALLPDLINGARLEWVAQRFISENILRPILPPPATDTTETDDTAPCELSPREIVGV